MKKTLLISSFLLASLVNTYAENPYKQFGCEGRELLTVQEGSGDRTLVLINSDSSSEMDEAEAFQTMHRFEFGKKGNIIYGVDNGIVTLPEDGYPYTERMITHGIFDANNRTINTLSNGEFEYFKDNKGEIFNLNKRIPKVEGEGDEK